MYNIYPRHSDFAFWTTGGNIYGIIPDAINFDDRVPGMTILKLFVIEICNVSFHDAYTLPIMLVPFIILFIALLKTMLPNSKMYFLLLLIYLLPLRYYGVLLLSAHETGFLLIITTMLILIINGIRNIDKKVVSFILIILSIAINYISYKMIFFMIIFISLSFIIFKLRFGPMPLELRQKMDFKLIALISFIYAASFNLFIYKSFIPVARLSIESLDLGYNKIYLSFFENSNPLSQYLFQNPSTILTLMRTLLEYIPLICCLYISMIKIKNSKNLNIRESVFLAFVLSSLCVLLVYNILGLFELTYLTFSCFLAFELLYSYGKRYKILALISVISLLLVTLAYYADITRNDLYFGQVDFDDSKYIEPTVKWYENYINDIGIKHVAFTDIFTFGKFANEFQKRNSLVLYPELLSLDKLTFILKPNALISPNSRTNHIEYYISNYHLRYFEVINWYNLKGWITYKNSIDENSHIIDVYSSGYIHIYLISKPD